MTHDHNKISQPMSPIPRYIAHRGNWNGKNIDRENRPDYILEALALGYDCEIDVHNNGKHWGLGHDEPRYVVTEEFIRMKGLWLHAKDIDTFEAIYNLVDYNKMWGSERLNVFMHEQDKMALTAKGFIWTCDSNQSGTNVVIMDSAGVLDYVPVDVYAYCADNLPYLS